MPVLNGSFLYFCIFFFGIFCVGVSKQNASTFNLDQSKILSFGNEFTNNGHSYHMLHIGGLPNMKRLFDDLLAQSTYNKIVVPTERDGNALTLTFNLDITRLISLNTETQVLSLDTVLSMMWYDHQLMWDPMSYGGIEMVRLPSNLVWQPDIILYNSAEPTNSIPSGGVNMVITNDGLVVYSPRVKTNSFCRVPKKQPRIGEIVTCSLKFGSWTYDGLTIDVMPAGLKYNDDREAEYDVDLTSFEREFNREWEVISFTVKRNVVQYPCCSEPYIDLTYKLTCRYQGDP